MNEVAINDILRSINGCAQEVQASALVSLDGPVLAMVQSSGDEAVRVEAISAAIISLGDHTNAKLSRGILEQILITGKDGHVLIQRVGRASALCTIAGKNMKLGLLLASAEYYARAMAPLLLECA